MPFYETTFCSYCAALSLLHVCSLWTPVCSLRVICSRRNSFYNKLRLQVKALADVSLADIMHYIFWPTLVFLCQRKEDSFSVRKNLVILEAE